MLLIRSLKIIIAIYSVKSYKNKHFNDRGMEVRMYRKFVNRNSNHELLFPNNCKLM